jgi:hypothetical protein
MSTSQVEPKKEKRIDRNHWMSRIQKFSFGIDAPTFYRGYCPFFWMTWAAVPAAPVVALAKIASVPLAWLWDQTTTPVIEYREVSRKTLLETPLQPSFVQFYRIQYLDEHDLTAPEFTYTGVTSSHIDAKRMEVWFTQNPNWKVTHLPQALAQYDLYLAEEAKAAEAAKARTLRFRKVSNTMSLCGSVVFKWLIPLMILSAIGTVGVGVTKLIMTTSLASFLFAGSLLAFIGAGVTLIYLICSFIQIYREIGQARRQVVNTEPNWFWRTLIVFAEGFFNACSFLKETVQMTYKAECPMIIWGEETGPIEKRAK